MCSDYTRLHLRGLLIKDSSTGSGSGGQSCNQRKPYGHDQTDLLVEGKCKLKLVGINRSVLTSCVETASDHKQEEDANEI